jgi:predicted amidophosphoribosyltransferase
VSVNFDRARDAVVPAALTRLDEASRADHIYLSASDRCAYLAQYCSGSADSGNGACHQLIRNFKCEPSRARSDRRRARYKQEAIATLGAWLRQAVPRRVAESCTWVPIPPSQRAGDPDFDDRLARTLQLAFEGYDVDVRSLLSQTSSTPRDHAGRARLSEQALLEILRVDEDQLMLRAVRGRVVLFDDVLTSGKHFKCCERRLKEVLPGTPIAGIFLMRRAPPRDRRTLGRAW